MRIGQLFRQLAKIFQELDGEGGGELLLLACISQKQFDLLAYQMLSHTGQNYWMLIGWDRGHFFLNHDLEGTFGNQERAWLLDADWLSTPAVGWFPALASNGFSETHRFCELRVWSKHGYFILSWKRINLQQSAVFWWKSKRIFPTKTVLIRSVWVGMTGVGRSSWPPNWKLLSSFCFGSPYL